MTVIRNELDKRIKKFSDIQSFKQYDDKYIGETGYFSDTISGFRNVDRCLKNILQSIDNNHGDIDVSNDYIFNSGDANYWRYFLPESLLKKKYRPLTEDEFKQMLNEGVFGQWVTLQNIADNQESCFQIVGYFYASDTFAVCFGSHEFSLQTLFDYYRWKDKDGNWKVFGVEE